MKKFVGLFVLICLFICCAFGVNISQELKITTTINPAQPAFQLYGSLTDTTGTETAAQNVSSFETATTILSTEDDAILDGPITVHCWIAQTNDARFKGAIVLSLDATAFSATIAAVNGLPEQNIEVPATVGSITALNPIGTSGAERVSVINNNDHEITMTYSTGKKAVKGEVAKFDVTWPQTDLPAATYVAYIQMSYTTV